MTDDAYYVAKVSQRTQSFTGPFDADEAEKFATLLRLSNANARVVVIGVPQIDDGDDHLYNRGPCRECDLLEKDSSDDRISDS